MTSRGNYVFIFHREKDDIRKFTIDRGVIPSLTKDDEFVLNEDRGLTSGSLAGPFS